jgi:signal-transduction protein with cAMP-binding, CBS, and nucleotidyltransferase domain
MMRLRFPDLFGSFVRKQEIMEFVYRMQVTAYKEQEIVLRAGQEIEKLVIVMDGELEGIRGL